MSLQLWLPFTSSRENKGLSSINFSGGTFIEERYGKSLTGTCNAISTLSADNFSFSMWLRVKENDSFKITLPVNTGKVNESTLTLSLLKQTEHCTVKLYALNNEPQMIQLQNTQQSIPELWDFNEWAHFTITIRNTDSGMKVNGYVNGVLLDTYSSTEYSIKLIPGTISISGASPYNDFRLYDNCLSQVEVERDYHTLLLHYPLRDSEIGVNTSVVYDCSGRVHNSTSRGELSVVSIAGGGRNSNCVRFTSNNCIKFTNPFETSEIDEFTVSFWIYLDSTNNYMGIFTTGAGAPSANNVGWLSINCNDYPLWFRSTDTYWYGSKTDLLPITTWHHIAMTFNKGTVQFYLNGNPYGSPITRTEKPTIHANNTFAIGDSYTGTSWSGAPFNGCLSDFRIYGIALNDKAIKDLYRNSATIDKEGNIHVFELVEV